MAKIAGVIAQQTLKGILHKKGNRPKKLQVFCTTSVECIKQQFFFWKIG